MKPLRHLVFISVLVLVSSARTSAQDFTEDLLKSLQRSGAISEEQYDELLQKYHASRGETPADARLEQALKELRDSLKGTEEPHDPRWRFRPGKGLEFRSDDNQFSMRLRARLIGMYSFTDLDDDRRNVGDYSTDVSDFSVDSARLYFLGHAFDPALTYKIQLEGKGSEFRLMDGLLNYAPEPELQFQVGQFKVPFSIQALHPLTAQLLSERAWGVNSTRLGRDVGAMVWGLVGPRGELEYNLALTNGEGLGAESTDNAHRFTAALRVQPFGGPGGKARSARSMYESQVFDSDDPYLSLGVSASTKEVHHVRDAAGVVTSPRSRNSILGLEGQLIWMGFSLQSEWFWRKVDTDPGPSLTDDAYYVQAGYFVIPRRLLVAARISELDLASDRIIAGGGGIDDAKVLTLGATLCLSEDQPNNFKIQADWGYRRFEHTSLAHGLYENIFRIKLIVFL